MSDESITLTELNLLLGNLPVVLKVSQYYHSILSIPMTGEDSFVLQVRTRDAKTHSLTVHRDWTISTVKGYLKKELAKEYGESSTIQYEDLSNDSMRLLCKGKVLDDDSLAGDHLRPDLVCHLVIRPQAIESALPNSAPSAEGNNEARTPTTVSSMQSLANVLRNVVSDALANRTADTSSELINTPSANPETGASIGQPSGDDQLALPSQPIEEQTGENPEHSRRRRRSADPGSARNVRRGIAHESGAERHSAEQSTSRLSDFQLPTVSSVHLHVHVNVNELDRVASRRQPEGHR